MFSVSKPDYAVWYLGVSFSTLIHPCSRKKRGGGEVGMKLLRDEWVAHTENEVGPGH